MKEMIFLVMALLVFTAAAFGDSVCFSQQPWLGDEMDVYTITNRSNIDSLDNDPNMVVFDNWQVDGTTPITQVRWWGGYYSEVSVTSFHISIHNSAGDHPDSLLASWDFDISETNETYYGTADNAANISIINEYHVTLPEAFAPTAGVEYWLGIYANIDDIDPSWNSSWGWSNMEFGTPITGNAISAYNYDPVTGSFQSWRGSMIDKMPCGEIGNAEMAFELTAIPEPSTIVLMISGAMAMFGGICMRARK